MTSDERPELSDGDLLRRFVNDRSDTAFAAVRVRYERLVFSTCFRELRDATLAEDAAQAVFLLLSRKARGLTGHASIAGWLFGASRLVSRNLLREETRRRRREERAYSAPIEPDDEWALIEPHFLDALQSLRASDREVILMRFFQELSHSEIATRLGLTENTARMRTQRGIERIRKRLAQLGVTVTVATLVSLLPTRSAIAATPSRAQPSAKAIKLASSVGVSMVATKAMVVAIASIVFVVATTLQAYRSRPHGMSAEDRRTMIRSIGGDWKGTLEYADDQTKQRFTFPTSVSVSSPTADSIRWVARYQGTSRVDETSFERDPKTGKFQVVNGGEASSHRLDGDYELTRERQGAYVFEGGSFAIRADVRLTLQVQGDRMILEELSRPIGTATYQFRNRFTLTR